MRSNRRQAISGIVAILAIAGGRLPAQDSGPPDGLEQVQQGIGDVGPLNLDLRIQPLDLRSPLGFDAVYRGRTTDQYGTSSDFYARRHGAVTAVFPRSIYTEVGEGIRSADVPPGTVYYIGALPPELMAGEAAASDLPLPPVYHRTPTALASSPDSLTELPFDAGIERLAAQRRAEVAADLIFAAAAAEKSRRDR